MSLSVMECVRYVGRPLYVQTQYGYGWAEASGGGLAHRIDWTATTPVPAHFMLRLRYLYAYRGEVMGGVGRVEEAGHPLDGWWAVCLSRWEGEFDFTVRLGSYSLILDDEAPELTPPNAGNRHYPCVWLRGTKHLAGCGCIAVDHAAITAWEMRHLRPNGGGREAEPAVGQEPSDADAYLGP